MDTDHQAAEMSSGGLRRSVGRKALGACLLEDHVGRWPGSVHGPSFAKMHTPDQVRLPAAALGE